MLKKQQALRQNVLLPWVHDEGGAFEAASRNRGNL